MTFAQPFQDYEILDRVGAGAMGTVFKARHQRLNRIVALKVLKPSLARDTRYVDRLRREARIVASLNHPYIVTGYDLGEEGGYHFFVMEFVEGKSLRALLVEWGMFAEEYVRRVARQVAQALDHAYQRGVIHRDIKPGNILIDETGNVKLTDMGLAKGPADLTLTRDGATVGTPQYISPEQARNPHDVDVRTDLYSLGATLYHMATGVAPFRGDTMAELITNVLHTTPVPPNELNPALSEGMSLVIRKLLAKDLSVRYQTPRDLLDDLDRVERALPPQVDVDRLAGTAGPRRRWWPAAVLAAVVVLLLGGAWWLGAASRPRVDATPGVGEFLAELDRELGALDTPGSRLVRLRALANAPLGSAFELEQRQRMVVFELQRRVDEVVDELTTAGWEPLLVWLRDPSIWPDRARVDRERLRPQLAGRAGIELGQLPPNVGLPRLDGLLQAVDRALADRDRELQVRFESFLATTVPVRAEERVRAGDFAAADRIWRDAMSEFLDGIRRPLPERLPEPLRRSLAELHRRVHRAAQAGLDAAEQTVADALRAEVQARCGGLAEQLETGLEPELAAAALQRLRTDLGQGWPGTERFRPARDPWPEIAPRLGMLDAAIAQAIARRDLARVDRRCDLAWRAFCTGRAGDALQLLADVAPPGSDAAARVASHREVLGAAAAVEAALLRAIAAASRPTVAFLRGGVEAVELRAEPHGGSLRLVGNVLGHPPRAVQLAELRFSELLARLQQQQQDPLADVPPAERDLGVAVARLAGDDVAGIGPVVAALAEPQRRFLVDDVWPRILRVRNEQPEAAVDRAGLFARLQQARATAAAEGPLHELERALFACNNRIPETERSPAEATMVREATAWLALAVRRRGLAGDLGRASQRGSEVQVQIAGDELVAEVVLTAPVLHSDAAEGWQLRDGLLEFAGGGRPWSELQRQMLQGNAGVEPSVQRTTLIVELVLPPASVGRRLWLFEFRGVGCLLALGADDTVHAAVVDGDLRREDVAQRAFQRAIHGLLLPPKVVAVPGAVHRLTIDLVAASSRASAMVRVAFEGIELAAERRPIDPDRPPTFAVHPQQELALRRIVVRARGL